MNTRRKFLIQLAGGVGAASLLRAPAVAADGPAKVKESDPLAQALGYKHNTQDVDQEKYPRHDDSQICANCTLYTDPNAKEWGPCSSFGGRLVAEKGWCSAYARRA